jgi:hypothetical protein
MAEKCQDLTRCNEIFWRFAWLCAFLLSARFLEQFLNFGSPLGIVSFEWAEKVARISRFLLHGVGVPASLFKAVGCSAADGHRLQRHLPIRAQV